MTAIATTKKIISSASSLALKLASLTGPLKRFFLFSPADDLIFPRKNVTVVLEKGTISVSSGSTFLTMVSIKGTREYLFDELKYPLPDELASSMALAMSDLGGPESDVTLSIPKAWVIIKTAAFPVTVKENLPDVVRYEMDRITPFTPEETYYDFKIIQEDDNRLTLLIAAARAETVMPYINALNQKGIRVMRLSVDLNNMVSLCRHMDSRPDSVFLNVDRDGYGGALVINKAMVMTFAETFGPGDERTKTEQIALEISSLLARQNKTKDMQIMVRMKDTSPAFTELLKSGLNIPVKMTGDTDTKLRFSSPVKNISFAAVAGVYESLQPDDSQLNLLRKGIKPLKKEPYLLSLLLVLVIAGMAALYIVSPLRIESGRLRDIAAQVASKKNEVKKVEALQKDLDALNADVATINNFKKTEPITLNILREITSILPKSAWITRARITESAVELEGYASSANELVPKLEASKYLRKVEFASSTFRDVKTNMDRFTIKMEIEGIKKITAIPQKGEAPKNEKK